jgi:excisionase family DNA binding protein
MTASADERRYRVAELAARWNVDRSTVYRMIYSGRLRAERHGEHGKSIRVTAAAAAEYLSGAVA